LQPFLLQVAEEIIAKHSSLEDVTIIFPNRRAALYFRHYLAQRISKPSWSPNLLSIEEFFTKLSGYNQLDKLDLIFRLYHIHKEEVGKDEPFDQFYFWGDMLLQDFEEVDKYLVDAKFLFQDLSRLKELDETFDYLTDEQKEFLLKFWEGFRDKSSANKEEFLLLWRKLGSLYERFTKALKKEKVGYEGLIQRSVIEKITQGKLKTKSEGAVVFVGFNALTKAEEKLMEHFVLQGATIYWDADDYYVGDSNQEAGYFFREYKKKTVLGKTIPEKFPTGIKDNPKTIFETGVPQRIGQAKLLVQDLKSVSIENNLFQPSRSEGIIPSSGASPLPPSGAGGSGGNTVIVLPDESMLLPVLHSLPDELESVNVTMGFPLRNTPMFSLLDLMLDLQINCKGKYFSHRQVSAILSHAYILELVHDDAKRLRDGIIEKNKVRVAQSEIALADTILELIFKPIKINEQASYLLQVVQHLGASLSIENRLAREYAFYFHRNLSRLHEVVGIQEGGMENFVERMKGFQKLFRQVVQSQKIPFVGEPLKGIQVMGVLETRNLDFENVFILSMNEGSLPSSSRQTSYIPHSIRKAYGLPAHDHHDATYAYLFYRLLQRSSNVFLYYNSEPDVLGSSEMSRFLRQLQVESGLEIKQRMLNNPIQVKSVKPLAFPQSEKSLEYLLRYVKGNVEEKIKDKPLSPSALNDYIECRLRFYLKNIAGMREAEEVEEELDARAFGNLLHKVMCWFYEDLRNEKQSNKVEASDFDRMREKINALMDRAFQDHYTLDATKDVEYEGQSIIVNEMVYNFASRILGLDKEYAPFEMEALEGKFFYEKEMLVNGEKRKILLGGTIDRIDKKESQIRVVDYKTGGDELSFPDIEALFSDESKRSKAAFQTIFYSLVYQKNATSMISITPGLFNRANLFKEKFKFNLVKGKEDILDIRNDLPEFENLLNEKLAELYSPTNIFDQTENLKNCEWCNFKGLCRR
jgi:PD-(D/E)XK nuclease superfamily